MTLRLSRIPLIGTLIQCWRLYKLVRSFLTTPPQDNRVLRFKASHSAIADVAKESVMELQHHTARNWELHVWQEKIVNYYLPKNSTMKSVIYVNNLQAWMKIYQHSCFKVMKLHITAVYIYSVLQTSCNFPLCLQLEKSKANKLNKNSSMTVHPSVYVFFSYLPEVHLIHGRDSLSVFITLKLAGCHSSSFQWRFSPGLL